MYVKPDLRFAAVTFRLEEEKGTLNTGKERRDLRRKEEPIKLAEQNKDKLQVTKKKWNFQVWGRKRI
jgi:hypothetical protein